MSQEFWIVAGSAVLVAIGVMIWSSRQYDRRVADYQKQIDSSYALHAQSQAILERQEQVQERSQAILVRQEALMRRAEALVERLEKRGEPG
jgi:hypothetical protein